jgi:iron complex transport system permease protein
MKKTKQAMSDYQQFIKKKILLLIFLGLAVFVTILGSLIIGSANTGLSDLIQTLIGNGSSRLDIIILGIRLPRALTATIVGASLAMAGAVMQSVLRNPLASSSTLGVSQGSAFGAAFAIIVFGAGIQGSTTATSAVTIYNPYLVTICAFIGGSLSTVVVLLFSKFKSLTPESLILAGVALTSLFSGGTALLQYFAEDVQIAAVVFWTFGDLGRTNTNELILLAIATLLAFIYFMANRWNYNSLENGKHTAQSLGVNVNKTIIMSMVVCSLLSAISVAFVGIISFVGLIAPHIMRIFVGNDYRYLIPGSAFCGALLLLLADIFARTIVSPVVLPIGAITSFLGAPMFLYLLFKGSNKRRSA